MKLQYCSDLHLEFELNEKFIKKYPLQVEGDILLLAGDIIPFGLIDSHKEFFDRIADQFEHIYWVPGNHEYYHEDITERSGILNEKIRPNLSLVNNATVDLDGRALICSTLWSKINPVNEWQIERAMSDFHVIKNGTHRFSIPVFNKLHEESMTFLQKAVTENRESKKIVVTHHVPTYQHYPAKYKNSILSEAFATELFDMIGPSGIHSWIYGHHHCNIPEFKIGATSMLTNQLGYVRHGEHIGFDRSKVIKL